MALTSDCSLLRLLAGVLQMRGEAVAQTMFAPLLASNGNETLGKQRKQQGIDNAWLRLLSVLVDGSYRQCSRLRAALIEIFGQ